VPTSPPSDPPGGAGRRPVIGITAGELVASYGVWKERASLVPADYIHAVANAGGVPVVLSPVAGIADALAERIDGLMLTGGVDVDAGLFGAERHPRAQRPDPTRDRSSGPNATPGPSDPTRRATASSSTSSTRRRNAGSRCSPSAGASRW